MDVTVTTTSGTSSTSSADHFVYSAAASPTVTAVSPNSGGTVGGTLVTITGSNFSSASAVTFGSTAATSFTVMSATTILATAPSATAGTVDVTVTTPSGTSSTSSADHFTWSTTSAPTVTGLGTTSGGTAGGTVVLITGTGFSAASAVNFGSFSATFVVNSATQITAVAPSQASGTVDITVTNGAGTSATSSSDHFTYSASSAPSVTGISSNPSPTAGGSVVTITGSGFTGTVEVYFGSVPAASFTVVTNGTIFAVAPAESAGTVDITVITPSGTSSTSSADHFAYATPATLWVFSGGLSTTHGTPYSGIVMSFSSSDYLATASQFTALITWGDGQDSYGTVTSGGLGFNVTGTNTYAATGSFTVQVQILCTDSGSAIVNDSMTVADAGWVNPAESTVPQEDRQLVWSEALALAMQQATIGVQNSVAATPWSPEDAPDSWLAGLVNAVDLGPADSLPSGLVLQVWPVKAEAASTSTLPAGTQARDSTADADERTEPRQARIDADPSATGQGDNPAAAQAGNARVRDALFVALAGEGWSEEATVDESTTAAANDTVFAATFLDDLFAVA